MRYRGTCHQDFETYWAHASEAEACGGCSPFQASFWLRAWLAEVLKPEIESPFFVEIRDATGPVLLMPLLFSRSYGLSVISGIDGGLSDYVAPLLLSADLQQRHFPEIVAAFLAALPKADVLNLKKMPLTIGPRKLANPLLLKAAKKMPYSSHGIALGNSWETLLAERTSTSSRATRRRKARKLAEKGAVAFVVVEDIPLRLEALKFTIRERKKRATQLGWDVNVLEDQSAAQFCARLVADPSLVKTVHVSTIAVSGELIAVHVGFVHGNALFWYLPTFRGDEWSSFSPGQMLLDRELQWAIEQRLDILDLTIGDERYKQEWDPITSPLFELKTGLSIVGTGAIRANQGMRALKRLLVKRPTPDVD